MKKSNSEISYALFSKFLTWIFRHFFNWLPQSYSNINPHKLAFPTSEVISFFPISLAELHNSTTKLLGEVSLYRHLTAGVNESHDIS